MSIANRAGWVAATLCVVVLGALLVRGLDYGPLHTDVIIIRAWFDESGVDGFTARYWETNRRHPLVGPLYTLAYRAFGKDDLPYNVIFHASRLLSGVMLAALLVQVGKVLPLPPSLAVVAGLALALTPVRVVELFTSINWFIEPTLTILLASSWCYAHALTVPGALASWRGKTWYALSLLLYVISVLIYESGLPWLAVNVVLGWLLRPNVTLSRRTLWAARDALPALAVGGAITYLLLVVFVPWQALAPEAGGGLVLRVLRDLSGAFAFPALTVARIGDLLRNGYGVLLGLMVGAAVLLGLLLARRDAARAWQPTAAMLLLGAVMILASILVGAAAREANLEYLDRINFGRAAGIVLTFTALIYLIAHWVRLPRWGAPVLGCALLIAPGAASLFRVQDAALGSRAQIVPLVSAVQTVRQTIYLPAHLIILTDDRFPLATFNNASDVILHETQQQLFKANEPATLDLLKRGAFEESYVTQPGTCAPISGDAPAGLCLDADQIINSRWALNRTARYEDVVIVYWDGQTLTILPDLSLEALRRCQYNVATAGAETLRTNPARLAIPLPETTINAERLCG